MSTAWTGDWRTLSIPDMLERADMLEDYYEHLPEGVTSEAWAEAQLIRMEVRNRAIQDERRVQPTAREASKMDG